MTGALFTTPRLRCRRWVPADLEALQAIYGDSDAMRWVDDGQPISTEDCARWLAVTARNYETRGYGMFALESREAVGAGEVVGFAGLVHPGGQLEPEVKYALRRGCWGRGLASEAVAALLAHGAEAHGLRRIIATVAPENLASQRVLEKVGARLVDVRPDADGGRTLVFEWRDPHAA